MPIRPKYSLGETRPITTRQFTDRKELIRIFQKAVKESQQKKQYILTFYGVGGIGKTSLRKKLAKLLEDNKTGIVWTVLDFEVPNFREQETALFMLRKSLKKRHKIQFPTFDIAYAVYWKKTRPQIPMNKENFPILGDKGVIADVISIVGSMSGFPIIGLVLKAGKVMLKAQKFLKNWWIKRGKKELSKLSQFEPKEIAERLPMYWAVDLKDYLQQKHLSAVFFIDSYDALWEGARSEARVFTQDEWVRELVSQLPEILWVICGRERVRWQEYQVDWGKYLKQHLVDSLADEDAKRFLRSCEITDEIVQKVIVEGSKGVPYYLDLAVDTYFEIKNHYHREPVVADFAKTPKEVFIRFLRYLDKSEIETLKVLSVPRFWNYSLLEQLITEFKTGYPITATSELCRFSFINQGALSDTWSMHQLMRESLKENLDPNVLKLVHQFLYNHYNEVLEEIDIKNIKDKYKNALTEAFYHGKSFLDGTEFFNWFRKAADVFDKAAQWKLLIPLYEEIAGILEKTLDKEHPDVAICLNNLASLYWSQGKYSEAELLHKRALKIREKVLGSDHLDVAASLNNLAVLYWNQGKYSEAESLHKRTLEIKERTLSPDHPDVAASLNNLANLYRDQGKYTDAELLYTRALEIREKAFRSDHPDVAQSLNNLAILYRAQGKYAEAEPLYKRALEIMENLLGKDHPDVASSLNNLALIYWNQGKYSEAESLHKRALEIREKALDTDHPDVAVSLENLGALYDDQRRHAEAESLHKQALEIWKKALGPDHPNVALILTNLANCYRGQGKHNEAEPLYKQALETLGKALDQDHPNLARCLSSLANCYRDQGKYTRAEPLYKQALGIWEKSLRRDHPDVATLLDDMAKFYKKIAKNDEAQKLEEQARLIRSKKR